MFQKMPIPQLLVAFWANFCIVTHAQTAVTTDTLYLPQTDTISTYDSWVTASFDFLDIDSIYQAEACIKNAMRLEPANPQNGLLFCNLGTIQRRLGKLTEAETSYGCAIALLPEMSSPRFSRAELYAEQERYLEAITDYNLIIEKEPTNEEALYARGLCRLMNNDTIGARHDFEFIDTFNPNSAKSRLGMAVVYKATHQYSLAIDIYNALIEANPKSWSLLRDRAECHYLSNRMGAALNDINACLELNSQDPMVYYLRAQIRYAKGDKEYARRDMNTAIEKGLPVEIVTKTEQKRR